MDYRIGWPRNVGFDDLKTIATLNPQLQSYSLSDYRDMRIWDVIKAELQNLKRICTSFSLIDAQERFKGPPMKFNNVEIFDVISDHDLVWNNGQAL